ncbi:MAG: DUF6624 domain-containing protein [Patescibacteria group bacterium]|nr:DUF6624 domain-containing protein [Patescibacteria group bacterium]
MPINKKLQQYIIDLAKKDQELRKKGCIAKTKREYQKAGKEIWKWDGKTLKEIKKIINQHGWPGFDLIGKRASHYFWLLVQHADRDTKFQKKCLKLMRKSVKANLAHPKDYAYLIDRVLCAENKKQKFGTQFIYNLEQDKLIPKPVADYKNVNRRRFKYKLKTIKQAEEKMNKSTVLLRKNLKEFMLRQKEKKLL